MLPASGIIISEKPWFLQEIKKDPDLQKSRPKRQTSARSRSLSYTVWFDSVLLLCLDTQCTISSCIATGFFPVKRLPEADRILQKIIPCIHRIAISQDTGFAPKQDIWLCPVTKFILRVLLSDSCLSCCQTSDRYTERWAGYIVQADLMAELYGRRISAVLAADTYAVSYTHLTLPTTSRV